MINDARENSGFTWQTEDEDPYWLGDASTKKLSSVLLADWEGFVAEAIGKTLVIDVVDPVFFMPSAYRAAAALPGGWNGTASVDNVENAWAPRADGLPAGLMLRRGDRVGLVQSGYKTCHIVTKPINAATATNQVIEISPPLLPNLFGVGAQMVFLDPVVRMHIVPGSWSAPRVPNQDTIASFQLKEAAAQS
ncbi:hypothetical protein [Devosia sp. Leaf420]|uniref:hypothetical protein n=1 Tax=Devosia sp. Leaf420 TaxID=1736374 RepID=UPI0012E7FD26|nr:hypothetical protein [Devosia sp. Leaf420]